MVQKQGKVTHRAVVLRLLQVNNIIYDATRAFYMLSPRDKLYYVNAFIYADLWMKNYNSDSEEESPQVLPYDTVGESDMEILISLTQTNKEIDNFLNSQFRSWNPKTWGLVCIEFSSSVIKNKLIKSPYLKEQKAVTSTPICTMNQYTAQEKRELETLCTEREMELLRKKCAQLEQECNRLKEENVKLNQEKDLRNDRIRKALKIMESESHNQENVINITERMKKLESIRQDAASLKRESTLMIRSEASKGSVPKREPTQVYY